MYNIQEKIKNPVFWVQIVGAFFLPVMTYGGLTGADLTSWNAILDLVIDTAMNPYAIALGAYGVWTALTNPNTPGISD